MSPNPEETADLVKFPEEILNGNSFFVVLNYHYTSKKYARTGNY